MPFSPSTESGERWREFGCRNTRLDEQPHPRLRPQRDVRPQLQAVGRIGSEGEPLADRRQDEDGFRGREGLADAVAGAGAEREVGESWEGLLELRRPAVGVELVRSG